MGRLEYLGEWGWSTWGVIDWVGWVGVVFLERGGRGRVKSRVVIGCGCG